MRARRIAALDLRQQVAVLLQRTADAARRFEAVLRVGRAAGAQAADLLDQRLVAGGVVDGAVEAVVRVPVADGVAARRDLAAPERRAQHIAPRRVEAAGGELGGRRLHLGQQLEQFAQPRDRQLRDRHPAARARRHEALGRQLQHGLAHRRARGLEPVAERLLVQRHARPQRAERQILDDALSDVGRERRRGLRVNTGLHMEVPL